MQRRLGAAQDSGGARGGRRKRIRAARSGGDRSGRRRSIPAGSGRVLQATYPVAEREKVQGGRDTEKKKRGGATGLVRALGAHDPFGVEGRRGRLRAPGQEAEEELGIEAAVIWAARRTREVVGDLVGAMDQEGAAALVGRGGLDREDPEDDAGEWRRRVRE